MVYFRERTKMVPFVCLFVSDMTQKVMSGYHRNRKQSMNYYYRQTNGQYYKGVSGWIARSEHTYKSIL